MFRLLRIAMSILFVGSGSALAVALAMTTTPMDVAEGPGALLQPSAEASASQPRFRLGTLAPRNDTGAGAPTMKGSELSPPLVAVAQPPVAQQIKGIESQLSEIRRSHDNSQGQLQQSLSNLQNQTFGIFQNLVNSQRDTGKPVQLQPPGNDNRDALDQPNLASQPSQAKIDGEGDDDLTINIQNADIREVLELFSRQGDLNIVAGKKVEGKISAALSGVSIENALDAILRSAGYRWRREGRFIYVGGDEDFKQMDRARDELVTRVYRLNYATAEELQKLLTPLLTDGIGELSVNTAKVAASTKAKTGIAADSSSTGGDDFAGEEVLMVRDYRSVLHEIDQIVAEVDRRPLQVAIEAMILSVRLNDENEMGVNFELLRNRDNARLISGFPPQDLMQIDVTSGGLKFGFLDSSLSAFIEALETVGETNVIAAPRLMCLNKQRAEILIGAQLGYVSTTVTENAATQAVEFLEVGTQLRFRPFVSSDGSIRLEVHPELSTGSVRIQQGFTLPDKEVTQVTTNVMCYDGSTVIIGGLIREDLSTTTSQIPLLGSLPLVGPVFRQKLDTTDRREIIVLVTPRIVGEPEIKLEGEQTGGEFLQRQANYADKMSPIGKRHIGRQYLRKATAAWSVGDASVALRFVNLAIHFDPQSRAAHNLHSEIVASTEFAQEPIHRHLRRGLTVAHPHVEYSEQGAPWREPTLLPSNTQSARVHDHGVPGAIRDITPLNGGPPLEEVAPQGRPIRGQAMPIPRDTSAEANRRMTPAPIVPARRRRLETPPAEISVPEPPDFLPLSFELQTPVVDDH